MVATPGCSGSQEGGRKLTIECCAGVDYELRASFGGARTKRPEDEAVDGDGVELVRWGCAKELVLEDLYWCAGEGATGVDGRV